MTTTVPTLAAPTPFAPDVPVAPEPTSEPVVAPAFGPVTTTDRLVNIDFVRGVALLGILLFNVAAFFSPAEAQSGLPSLTRLPAADRAAALFVLVLVAGKFISTFSMLFGYGLLGQVERAHAAGRSPGGFAFRRLGVLALFGVLHGLALWYGDVLFLYASLGVFVVLWRGNSAGSLLIIAGVLLGLYVLGMATWEMIQLGVRAPAAVTATAEATGPRGWEAIVAAQGNPQSPVWMNAETAAYREGPWADAQAFRMVEWGSMLFGVAMGAWVHIVGMFALGAWMWRKRFFAPEQAALRRRVLAIFLTLGLALAAAAGCLYGVGLLSGSRAAWSAGAILGVLAVVTLPLGYVSGLAILAERLPGWLVNTVASAGRMALTVYLGQTVIATFLSYHWGLGWFGRIGPWQQLVLALVIWLALVLFSRLWLRLFAQGPMEWLWRKLEYGR